MVSAAEVEPNLVAAGRLIAAAAAQGAQVVALPEYFCLLGRHETDKVKVREKDGAGPIQDFLAEAALKNRVWLIGGTLPVESDDPLRVRSACLVFDASGRRIARYDKIHLFAFARGSEKYDETRVMQPGDTPVVIDSPYGRLGLSVCYDVRFPEMYRATDLAGGPVDMWFVPSAFTATTGAAHWEVLLRARAIENLCYVAGVNRTGSGGGLR